MNDPIFYFIFFSEPKERAKEPDKGNSGLSVLRQGVIANENSSHDDIQRSCQQLIDDINAKRKRDTDLLNGKVKIVYSSLGKCPLYVGSDWGYILPTRNTD